MNEVPLKDWIDSGHFIENDSNEKTAIAAVRIVMVNTIVFFFGTNLKKTISLIK